MAPVIAFTELPKLQAGTEQRTVNSAGKLLHACKQRIAIDDDRSSLNDPDLRRCLHPASKPHHNLAGHDTVRI